MLLAVADELCMGEEASVMLCCCGGLPRDEEAERLSGPLLNGR